MTVGDAVADGSTPVVGAGFVLVGDDVIVGVKIGCAEGIFVEAPGIAWQAASARISEGIIKENCFFIEPVKRNTFYEYFFGGFL